MQPSAQFVPTPGAKAAGNTGYAIVNGSLQGSATGKLPLGSNVIDVTARVIPDKPSLGAAVGRFIYKVAWPLQVGSAVYDLIKEMGLDASRDESGALSIVRPDPNRCTASPCYQYQLRDPSTLQGVGDWHKDKAAACVAGRAIADAKHGGAPSTSYSMDASACYYVYSTSPYSLAYNFLQRTVSPNPDATVPMTQQQLADKIASESGWPSSSNFPEVVRQTLESGETITAPTPTVTGPSTVQGSKSTTTEGGRTVEKQTVYNITYNNNQVSYTTTVTTITNENGQTTTSTETKENEPPPDECAKNPDSLNCADLDVPAGEIPRTSKNIVYTPESWFGGGTCPADKTMTTHGMTIKVWDWQGSCYWLVNYFRPILLIIATIVALMIVLPRGNA